VFETTAHDLAPGVVFRFRGFPSRDLGDDVSLMVVSGRIVGRSEGDWLHEVNAFFADQPYHPPLSTPKPRTFGVESATVVGPEDDEIHTDEFARVRVKFHWDRDGARDERSSCWIPVSQPWGGAGFGAVNIPRVGQEVLIDFLGADPDRPVVVGRVFTKTQPVPYELPKHKTVSGIRSQSAYRYVMGAADGPGGGVAAGTSAPVVSPLTMPGGVGTKMGPERIQAALDGAFGAVSPNSETHRWRGSEVTFDDQCGREVFYMQAERNLNIVVKNDMTTVVGNARSTKIGTDDLLEVDSDQLIAVENNRCVTVQGHQVHQVVGDINQQSLEGNQVFDTLESFQSFAKHHLAVSEESLTLQVGRSILHMKPDFVILQTPYLFLNPGDDATQQAIETGERPQTPEEMAEAAREALVQTIMAEITEAYERGEVRNLPQLWELGNSTTEYSHLPEWGEALDRWDEMHRLPGESAEWPGSIVRYPPPPSR
jgi:type VI secretion system secreted protein VgrG